MSPKKASETIENVRQTWNFFLIREEAETTEEEVQEEEAARTNRQTNRMDTLRALPRQRSTLADQHLFFVTGFAGSTV